jgi:ankyrin repeat protein
MEGLLHAVDGEGNTPLHRACEENRADVALLLLEEGAKTTDQNKAKKLPFDMASEQTRRFLEAHV